MSNKSVHTRPEKKPYKITLIDMAVTAIVLAAVSVFFYRMVKVLDYHWEWKAIGSYFFYRDEETGKLAANILIKGFVTTIKLSAWATLLGFVLGTLSGVMGARGSVGWRLISRIYVETIRNIPSLVLVIIFYYFVSSQLLDLIGLDEYLRKCPGFLKTILITTFAAPGQLNSFLSAVIALGIYEGAYISEIVRGGIVSIPSGQWEACYSIGLDSKKAFLLVILPQVLRRTAFPMAGQFISTIKDSAIVSVISIQELTFQGMEIMAATFLTFEIWTTITLLYFILTFSLSRLVSALEKKYAVIY